LYASGWRPCVGGRPLATAWLLRIVALRHRKRWRQQRQQCGNGDPVQRHAYLFFLDFEDASGRTPCKRLADASNVAKADAAVMLPVKNLEATQ